MRTNQKLIAVKFKNISEIDIGRLHAFISRELIAKNVVLDTEISGQNLRSVFRVINRGSIGKIHAVVEARGSLPRQEFDVEIINMSIGGCLMSMPGNIPIAKGGPIFFEFAFIEPTLVVFGSILSSRQKELVK